MTVVSTRLSAGTSPVQPAVALVARGIGWACVLSPATVSALSAVPERQAGLAVGSSWTFHNLGGAIGPAASVVLFRAFASDQLTTELTRRHQATGDRTDSVVTNPEHATAVPAERPASPPEPGADGPRARGAPGTVRAVRQSQRTCSRVTRVVRPAHTARTTPTQRRRSSR
ncbi:hypothetical protein [Streptomyces tricolor]|uniref:hypothetical protein n=1 Tax=Streptomyces tricolor TaxID=68277 RepID=UPI0036EF774F